MSAQTAVSPTPLELLAPARDAATAIAAIDCGADAVYMGGPHHGARAAAGNSIDDIRRVCEYAHRYRGKVYVTFNTLIYEDELQACRTAVRELYNAGVDALIVQDMALLNMDIPPIALHASTQCDTRTPAKARFLQDVGMSCIVLPREMTLDEIRAVRAVTTVPLEGFVHGALCVCYSGDCRASLVGGGRSANRGECAQICRLPYNLVDDKGNVIVADRHLLSLRDMNRLDHLREMADAGIQSFKIEGRLKDRNYVMSTVTAYSQALDAICRIAPDRYCRASAGRVTESAPTDLSKTFNRGYTSYFLTNTQPQAGTLGSHLTPKFAGERIGRVRSVNGKTVIVDTACELHNGDGLCFFGVDGRFTGFRINRAEGTRLTLNSPVAGLRPGLELFRNYDKAFDDLCTAARPRRVIDVDFELRPTPTGFAVEVSDSRGCRVTVAVDCEHQTARTPQTTARRDIMGRLGDTIYNMVNLTDNLGDMFVPAKVLTAARRQALEALDRAAAATRIIAYRRPKEAGARYVSDELTFHDNVANSVAEGFYRERGVQKVQRALEVDQSPFKDGAEVEVMTCRYCLRRELGACLKTADADRLPRRLFLHSTTGTMRPLRLHFDCANCRMHLFTSKP